MHGVARHNPLTECSFDRSPGQDPTNYGKWSLHFKTYRSLLRMWNERHSPRTQFFNPKPSSRIGFAIYPFIPNHSNIYFALVIPNSDWKTKSSDLNTQAKSQPSRLDKFSLKIKCKPAKLFICYVLPFTKGEILAYHNVNELMKTTELLTNFWKIWPIMIITISWKNSQIGVISERFLGYSCGGCCPTWTFSRTMKTW